MVEHPFLPVFDGKSKILILGSFPSVKSRETDFYYGHPRNRFWPLLATLLNEKMPSTNEEKRQMLLSHGIALWDVIASCEITGSADSSIRNALPTDLSSLFCGSTIAAVFTNGKTAHRLYQKYQFPLTGIPDVCLPSTSPANAAASADRLIEDWSAILKYL